MRVVRSLGPAFVWAAVLFALSRIPGGLVEVTYPFPHFDKAIHFLLYCTLGATLALGRRWGGDHLPHLLLLAGGWLYGALDEWHQSFVPGRSPEFGDWIADVAGVTVGYLLLLSLRPPGEGTPERKEPHPPEAAASASVLGSLSPDDHSFQEKSS